MIDLGRQFSQRIRAWQESLEQQISVPAAEVSFEGFFTKESLSPSQAEERDFHPCPPGTGWGGCWEYGWFRGDLILPESCEGRRVVLFSGLDGEQIFYVNGHAAGAVDREHPYILLTRNGRAGERFHLLAESYAGHGPRLEKLPPCPPERRAVPDPPAHQCLISPTFAAVWEEEAYQLLMDLKTLTDLLPTLPDTSLRALRVAEALDRMTRVTDLELPAGQRKEAYLAGRACLREVLDCHNGSTAPELRIIGQSHIDLAWLWPLEETFHKACRTYSTQLALLDEYPDYHWLLVEPALLDMLKSRDPELWQRTLSAFRRGQIHPEGAFYVECDTQIPGGESLIRQLMAGKAWFREEFGVESKVAWLPDCFGFSAVLPQLFRKLDISYFATQKLLRADPECETFPYQNFIWEGLDGSEVEALSFMRDNGPISPASFHQRWDLERTQKTGISVMLHPFGYGDGGGGPTRDMVEMSLRLRDLEGVARSRYSGLREYFEEVTAVPSKNRWVGELYLAWHRGTWTSQRRNKALIRRAEEALREAELIASLTHHSPLDKIREAWMRLMFQQFHDIAGGAGISRVHEESSRALEAIVADMNRLTEELLSPGENGNEGITDKADKADKVYRAGETDRADITGRESMVLSSLSWPRREPVRASSGEWVWLSVPGSGVYAPRVVPVPGEVLAQETEEGFLLENRYLSLLVDHQGRIVSLVDRENNLPLLRAGQVMNDWRLYRNVQPVYDAWELDRDWPSRVIPGAVQAEAGLEIPSPGVAEIKIRRSFGSSSSLQTLRLFANSRRVDFESEIDWQERHRMLKAHFESNIHSENALHEIQFGHVSRPAHRGGAAASDRYEVCQQRWSAMTESNRGFALLNDGIFALSSNRGELALTLLRAPLVPAEDNNRGFHRITYSLYPFAGSLEGSGVVQAGYALNSPLRFVRGGAGVPGFRMLSDTLILETVKPAEDGKGLILRIYQSMNSHGVGTLELPYEAELREVSMDERTQLCNLGRGKSFSISAAPFEIRTFRLTE